MIIVIKMADKITTVVKLPKVHKKFVNDYIKFFKGNKNEWFNSIELQYIFNVSNDSIVRSIINYLRVRKELPIVSSHKGYKYSTDKNELRSYYKKLHYRALTILSAAKGIKKNC